MIDDDERDHNIRSANSAEYLQPLPTSAADERPARCGRRWVGEGNEGEVQRLVRSKRF